MMSTLRVVVSLFCLLVLAAGLSLAQAPTGGISGTITDQSGAVIPNATITVTNPDTGLTRNLSSGAVGIYTAASLPAGNYRVKVEAAGFKTRERMATVVVGSATIVDFQMDVGAPSEVVTVAEAAPLLSTEAHKIDGVVSRQQIQNLPLNGRNFLQLAFLEPGVTVSPASLSQYNAQFSVSILGAASSRTRITVDGANVNNPIEGGSQQNFSQEVIQEFQVSSLNFDLSTGITGSGAINIVTRSGSNDFHGSGYFYFRDHNMAAYQGLSRDPRVPDPFFARRQSGFYLGGPLKKDKLFFFTNLEHINQAAVVPAQPLAPEFAKFGGLFSFPYIGNQFSQRFDYRINQSHNLYLRYSHDGNHSVGPRTANSLPSNWVKNVNWADQSVGSLTSSLRPTLVNEARFAYTYWHNRNQFPSPSDCPNCIGLGFPQIDVVGAGFTIGNTTNAPQGRDLRHYITSDNMTWQRGAHGIRFGGEWDYAVGTGFWAFLEPAAMVVYSPAIVSLVNSQLPAALRIPIPTSFNTIDDILKLPLAGFNTAVGDPGQPPPFQIDRAKPNNRFHVYWQDTWKVRPRFTLNYGLAYSYESNQLNHDLTKPAYLTPLLGSNGLGPERHDTNNWSPSLGFSWAVSKDSKTVIRAGAGLYYDTTQLYRRLVERATIGPLGNGRFALPGSFVPNPYGAVPGLPAIPCAAPGLPVCVKPGDPLSFTTVPTYFTGGHLVAILPAVRAALLQQLGGNPYNTDLSIRNIEVFKTTPFPDSLITRDFTLPYSEHVNVGVQREIRRDLVVSADFVFRQTIHALLDNADFNRWVDPAPAGFTARNPVIPRCTSTAQALNPKAQCSSGQILVNQSSAREHYKGLLVKVDKRMSNRYQFLVSYAYSSQAGWNGVTNQDNWFDSWGPNGSKHILNASGVVALPWDLTNLFCPKKTCAPFEIAVIQQMASKGPFNPIISAVDFNGDGTSNDRIPGVSYNAFNRSLSKSELVRLISDFNQNFAGKKTSRGQDIPPIVLPANFQFNNTFFSTDLRLSKTIAFHERYKITLMAEAFNLFNVANLGGYGNNLRQVSNFGQPSNRSQNSFGSGGPRAFQIAARFTF